MKTGLENFKKWLDTQSQSCNNLRCVFYVSWKEFYKNINELFDEEKKNQKVFSNEGDLTVAYMSGVADGKKKLESANKSLKEQSKSWEEMYHKKTKADLKYQYKAEETVEKLRSESLDNLVEIDKLKEEIKELKKPKYCTVCGYEDDRCGMCSALKEDFEPKLSLAELANEKGFNHEWKAYYNTQANNWVIVLGNNVFCNKVYAIAEKKAIEYLEGLKC